MFLRGRAPRAVAAICAAAMIGFVAQAQAKLTSEQIKKIVQDSKVLGSDASVSASSSGKEAVISTYRNPRATDKDCKIDAVLIAKKLMDADPQGTALVKVLFYDPSNAGNCRQVTVREGDVKAFAARAIDQDTLLAEIELTRGPANPLTRQRGRSYSDGSPEVLPGIYRGERVQLLGEIQTLQEHGVSVTPFLADFFQIEDRVRQNDEAGVIHGLQTLSVAVNHAADLYNQQMRARTQAHNDGLASVGERVRKELGEFAPAPGIMFRRRYRVGRRIKDLKDEGQGVDMYSRLFREIEELAARNDLPALRAKLRYTEQLLGLPIFEQPG